MRYTAYIEPQPEGGYVGWVAEVPGAITQGESLQEVRENLKEAVALVIEANRTLAEQQATGEALREDLDVDAA